MRLARMNAKSKREPAESDLMAAARAYMEAEMAFQMVFQLVCREDQSFRQTSLKAVLDKLEATEEALGIGPIVSRREKPSSRQSVHRIPFGHKSFRQTSYNAPPDTTTPRRRASDSPKSQVRLTETLRQTSCNARLERIKASLTYLNFYLVLQPHPEAPELWMADAYRISKGQLVFVVGARGYSQEEAMAGLAGELGIQTDVDIADPRD